VPSQRRKLLDSDLIGIPTALAAIVVVALTIALFALAGPVAGLLVGVLAVGLSLYLLTRTSLNREQSVGVRPPRVESAQQLLVVADRGLENPALLEAVAERAARGPLAVRVLAPVVAGSRLQALADDLDEHRDAAQARLDSFTARVGRDGVEASGRVDPQASPARTLLDGLREFPADEVLIVPADEADWGDAAALAERVRGEGIRLTEIG
jgi:hypothetical protein